MSFLSWPTWSSGNPTSTPTSSTLDETPPLSSTLNLLAAIGSTEVYIFSPTSLNIFGRDARLAGTGAYSAIEVGNSADPRLGTVAIKRGRSLPRVGYSFASAAKPAAFDDNLARLTLELRILLHPHLSSHANILNVLGICPDSSDVFLTFALVLEYSPHGTLGEYLRSDEASALEAESLLDLATQVGHGLTALHELKVAHCDVKTENVLVFFSKEDENWRPKICDFGQSLVGLRDRPNAKLPVHYGTPLLNAPEIRTLRAFQDPHFGIEAALLTDVFSFGLLVWEVMKRGHRYFDLAWMGVDGLGVNGGNTTPVGVSEMESFLNGLPLNSLRAYALDFLDSLGLDASLGEPLRRVFTACLADSAENRGPMQEVGMMMRGEERSKGKDSGVGGFVEEAVAAWTTRQSLREISRQVGANSFVMENMPNSLRRRIFLDLKAVATSPSLPMDARAHAAMTVSEAFTLGFGCDNDSSQALHWLEMAAQLGSSQAASWYPRVCHALGIPAERVESAETSQRLEHLLSTVPPDDYLASRVYLHNFHNVDRTRDTVTSLWLDTDPVASSSEDSGSVYRIAIFNEGMVDHLCPSLLYAYLGYQKRVLEGLGQGITATKTSPLGFNVAHYSCLGGHVALLRQLASHDFCLTQASVHGITPLHLAVLFSQADVEDAVDILLAGGAAVDAQSSEIMWDAHDIVLSGPPLSWATATRNRPLVRRLMTHCPPSVLEWGLHTALSNFFWEIAEDILGCLRGSTLPDIMLFPEPARQFAYWIAHGSALPGAIERTVQWYKKNKPLGLEAAGAREEDWGTEFEHITRQARTTGEIHLIATIMSTCSSEYLKLCNPGSDPPIYKSIESCGHNAAWRPVFDSMLDLYTAEELDGMSWMGYTPLIYAVFTGSVYAATALLRKGVDVHLVGRTEDGESVGPTIHTWLWCDLESVAVEMLTLLLDAGANPSTPGPVSQVTVLQELVMSYQHLDLLQHMLAIAAEEEGNDRDYGTVLHLMYGMRPQPPQDSRVSSTLRVLHFQRFLSGDAGRYVNLPDEGGRTLLHKAALCLDVEVLRLLLDAGADAGVPYTATGSDGARLPRPIYPLQIACMQSWIWERRTDPELHGRVPEAHWVILYRQKDVRSQSEDITRELLRWHSAEGDGLFEGTSDLHVACAMGAMAEVDSLRAQADLPHCGQGQRQQLAPPLCRWPDHRTLRTPEELLSPAAREEELAAITLLAAPW